MITASLQLLVGTVNGGVTVTGTENGGVPVMGLSALNVPHLKAL